MLRLALGFLAALLFGAGVTGAGLSRMLPPPLLLPSAPPVVQPPSAAPDASLHHLPDWVQTRQPADLWSGPDRQAVRFVQLPAWTFLKVVGVQNDRLEVVYAGDGMTRQAGPGWVALGDVQPADPSGDWLRNHRASHLFAAASGSQAVADVPQWSWMLGLDAQAEGRLHVRVYAPGLSKVVGEGWLLADDVGPADPPRQPVWTGLDAGPVPAPPFTSHAAFIEAVAAAAQQSSESAPVSVTVAQAILESDWGESLLSRQANNYFGIKATGRIGNDGAIWMPTLEYVNGGSFSVVAPFRAYKSLADSVADHAQLFHTVSVYRSAVQAVHEPDEFARRIAQAGYSTDPNYTQKLIDLMHRHDLYRFDAPGRPGTPNTA